MSAAKVIVLGFGQERAVARALGEDRDLPEGIDCRVLHISAEPRHGVVSFAQAIERVKGLPPDGLVAVMAHDMFRVARDVPPFDLVMVSFNGGDHAPATETVPLNLMRAAIRQTVEKGFGARLLRLAKASAAPVVCLGPPAPRDDAHLPADATESARPGALRLKLWTLQQQALAAHCRRNGIGFLANPIDARLATGFLKPRYHSSKGNGASGAYGALVIEQLSRVLAPPAELPAALA
jgi:hypothetical protein